MMCRQSITHPSIAFDYPSWEKHSHLKKSKGTKSKGKQAASLVIYASCKST